MATLCEKCFFGNLCLHRCIMGKEDEKTLKCCGNFIPTADVVPKSEVDRLNAVMKEMDEQRAYTINMLGESLEKAKSEVEELSGKYEDLKLKYADLQKDKDELIAWGNDEKTEVAREIFEEIEQVRKEIVDRMQEFINEWKQYSESTVDYFGGKYDAMETASRIVKSILTDKTAELKKEIHRGSELMETRNELVINAQLPSMNQYQNACRSHWSKGAEFKKSIEELIGWNIRSAITKQTLRKVENPCEIFIEWHERTKKRDVDNIQSAQKFILDALQHHGIIKNDNRKYIKQIYHKIIEDNRDFVVVRFEEKE